MCSHQSRADWADLCNKPGSHLAGSPHGLADETKSVRGADHDVHIVLSQITRPLLKRDSCDCVQHHLERILLAILTGLADESEGVKGAA